MGTKTYDSRCYLLAEVFLEDEEDLKGIEKAKELVASAIQQAIEDEIQWIRNHKEDLSKSDTL
jgi:hypothetical protein